MASVDQVQETKDLVARINEYGTAFRELLTGSDQDALRLYKTEIEPEEESDSRCSQSELEQCIGNMLFDVVQLARLANIDPELCLQARNQDFIQSVQSETKDTKNEESGGIC